MKYTVIIEQGENSYGAYVPDLPGCVAVAESRNEVVLLIQEAITMHLQAMKESGETIPSPTSTVEVIDVAA